MNKVEVRIDKRTELMSVLLYVSNYRKEFPHLVLFNKDVEYVRDVHEAFSKFANHKAVELLNEIVEKLNFSYNAPFQLAWELKEDYSIDKLLADPFKDRLQSAPVVESFMKEIKDFAEKSNFEQFYNEHLEYYQKCIDRAKTAIDFEELSHFEEFFKEKTKREYIVNLLPLCARNGSFYDLRYDDKFIENLTNDETGKFNGIENNLTGRLFNIFTLCEIRRIVERDNIRVPETKEFAQIVKNRFTPSNNLQYICEEIAKVMRTVFKEKFCPQFLEIDPDLVKHELEMFKSKGRNHVYEIYDILTQWQKSTKPLENFLQQIFDLF